MQSDKLRLVELLLELFDRPRGDVKRLLELIKERFLLVRLLGGKDVCEHHVDLLQLGLEVPLEVPWEALVALGHLLEQLLRQPLNLFLEARLDLLELLSRLGHRLLLEA